MAITGQCVARRKPSANAVVAAERRRSVDGDRLGPARNPAAPSRRRGGSAGPAGGGPPEPPASPRPCLRSRLGRRAPVERLVDAREDRAGLAGVVADRDHVVEQWPRNSVTDFDLGTPSSARPRPGRGSSAGGRPWARSRPSRPRIRSPPWWRRSASARIERAQLPEHTKRTRIGADRARAPSAVTG